MRRLLFICTGNYYRSRYAEIRFNVLAFQRQLAWRAESRGLAPDPRNLGPMSPHTIEALTHLGIAFHQDLREPIAIGDADFAAADHVVALKEAEHRRPIERDFPQWLSKVEFWHVHDIDCALPAEALSELDQLVTQLAERLSTNTGV